MKILPGLVWATTVASTYAASTEALVYLSDNDSSKPNLNPPSISPNTARLLLAKRLSVSQYHDLGDVDDSVLEILDKYGGTWPTVFSQRADSSSQSQLLLVVEGVEHPEGTLF